MAIIWVIIIVLFIVYITWTWNNLYNFSNINKIINIIIATLVLSLITFLLFNISKAGVKYPNEEMISDVRNILILLFTPINGILTVPFISKQLSKIKENDINITQLKKKLIIMLLIFIIVVIIECVYMKNIQLGILKIFENIK